MTTAAREIRAPFATAIVPLIRTCTALLALWDEACETELSMLCGGRGKEGKVSYPIWTYWPFRSDSVRGKPAVDAGGA